jgi:hypothetical protein
MVVQERWSLMGRRQREARARSVYRVVKGIAIEMCVLEK